MARCCRGSPPHEVHVVGVSPSSQLLMGGARGRACACVLVDRTASEQSICFFCCSRAAPTLLPLPSVLFIDCCAAPCPTLLFPHECTATKNMRARPLYFSETRACDGGRGVLFASLNAILYCSDAAFCNIYVYIYFAHLSLNRLDFFILESNQVFAQNAGQVAQLYTGLNCEAADRTGPRRTTNGGRRIRH